jgi:hypothetical protein
MQRERGNRPYREPPKKEQAETWTLVEETSSANPSSATADDLAVFILQHRNGEPMVDLLAVRQDEGELMIDEGR